MLEKSENHRSAAAAPIWPLLVSSSVCSKDGHDAGKPLNFTCCFEEMPAQIHALSIQSLILNLTPKSEENTVWYQALCLSLRNTRTHTERKVLGVFFKLQIRGTKSQKNSLKACCSSQISKSSLSSFPCTSAFYSFAALFMAGHSHRAVTSLCVIYFSPFWVFNLLP